MLCLVSFLHVLEASIIDVTSVSGVGDGYCATLIPQSFYRMPAYKIYSCQKMYTMTAKLFYASKHHSLNWWVKCELKKMY